MKKIYLLCAGIFTMCFSQNAFSVDFSEKFYGKAYIGIGYNKQTYTGLWKEKYIDPYESLRSSGIIPHTKNHTIDINIGNNIYFRMNSYLRPFIGAEIVGKIPIKDHGMWAGYIIRLYERFVVHGKIGLKINVVKGWFAVSPYYIVGANVYQIKSDLEKYPQCASIAQLVEHGTENPCVVGSIPTGGTINLDLYIFWKNLKTKIK